MTALLGTPLDPRALLDACLIPEETVAGRHLDNIAPSLLGGIVLIRCMEPPDIVTLPVPEELTVVLVRAFYTWQVFSPGLDWFLINMAGNYHLLSAASAFRNEPYNNGVAGC